jgi:hypothetical protein
MLRMVTKIVGKICWYAANSRARYGVLSHVSGMRLWGKYRNGLAITEYYVNGLFEFLRLPRRVSIKPLEDKVQWYTPADPQFRDCWSPARWRRRQEEWKKKGIVP